MASVTDVSWIDRVVEERLAEAASNGELAAPELEGRPIPDLHWERPDGWWTKRFVERELSHDRRAATEAEIALARARFWRATAEDEVRVLVADANAVIDRANARMIATDRLDRFDADDVVERWRRLSHG